MFVQIQKQKQNADVSSSEIKNAGSNKVSCCIGFGWINCFIVVNMVVCDKK